MLSKLASRAALAVAVAAVVVTACDFSGDFTIRRTYTQAKGNAVVANAGSWASGVQHVDMAAEAPGAWKRRGDLKSLDLVSVTANVTAMRAGANVPVTGTIVLSRGTTRITGNWSHTLGTAAPESITITMPAEADALLMDAIRGDGKFDIEATATTTGHIDLDVEVLLTIGINYHVGP